jgi:hypothetical protein
MYTGFVIFSLSVTLMKHGLRSRRSPERELSQFSMQQPPSSTFAS